MRAMMLAVVVGCAITTTGCLVETAGAEGSGVVSEREALTVPVDSVVPASTVDQGSAPRAPSAPVANTPGASAESFGSDHPKPFPWRSPDDQSVESDTPTGYPKPFPWRDPCADATSACPAQPSTVAVTQ
jgi:hypothetical protein